MLFFKKHSLILNALHFEFKRCVTFPSISPAQGLRRVLFNCLRIINRERFPHPRGTASQKSRPHTFPAMSRLDADDSESRSGARGCHLNATCQHGQAFSDPCASDSRPARSSKTECVCADSDKTAWKSKKKEFGVLAKKTFLQLLFHEG